MFVISVEAIIYLLLYNSYDCTFDRQEHGQRASMMNGKDSKISSFIGGNGKDRKENQNWR